jgi:hypothetical protein
LNTSTELGGRINIDISSVIKSSYGGAKFWLLIQDDYKNYLWPLEEEGNPTNNVRLAQVSQERNFN